MYIERKSDIDGDARIGRITWSRTRKTIWYQGRQLQTLNGRGFKANYFDVDTGEKYWVSGCKKSGGDRLYSGLIHIDDDVREEYWVKVRGQPQHKSKSVIRCVGKYAR
jgi:hypothetical protein